MCLIIKTDNPNKLSLNLLQTAYNNNSDGFGVMFCNKGKLHTQKIVPKTFKDIEKLWSKYKDQMCLWDYILDLILIAILLEP